MRNPHPTRRPGRAAGRRTAVGIVSASVALAATATGGQSPQAPAGASLDHPAVVDLADLPVDVRPLSSTPSSARPPTLESWSRFGPTTGAEVEITNATAWHDVGIDGSGVRIGVIDFFDVTSYWNVAEHGPLPLAGVTARCLDRGADCSAEFFDGIDSGGEDHGVEVVEVLRDMAPGAQIFIGQANTVADYRQLLAWFASKGVRIVNRSLGSRYDGPGDGRGPLDDVVAEAVRGGLLWVNSGGNNADGKYYRHAVRLSGDRVAFGPSGTSTYLRFSGCTALGGIRWANDWDRPPAARTDYDAYLWESPTGRPAAGRVVASSTLRQRLGAPPIEQIPDDRCPAAGSSLYLEIRWRGGDTTGDVLEILDYGNGIANFTQAEHSAAVSVVDSAEMGVIAVGAVDPTDSGTVADYSSRGPTNDGRIAPHVVAPAGFASSVNGWFSGTSAAAAVVSGGAALLLDAELAADPISLGSLVRSIALDRGPAGPDNTYGHGEFRLPDPPAPVDDTPSRFVALDAPTRILDTRPEESIGPPPLLGEASAGELLRLPILGLAGVPTDGVTAVAVNVVSVRPDRRGYVQALPTLGATVGGFSNLNVDTAGQVRANFAIVPVGADGSISLFPFAGGNLVVDLLGWFERTSGPVAGGRFVELTTAERVLDTRAGAPLSTGSVRPVPMPSGVDPALVDALVVTVTAAESTAPGWLQIFPSDRPDVIGRTSTVNVVTTGPVANTAIVPVAPGRGAAVTGGFAAGGSSHAIVDVVGYITSPDAPESPAGRYRTVRPARAFDSRPTGPLDGGEVVVVDGSAAPGVIIPSTASAVMWNLTAAAAQRRGYLRAWPADGAEPATSSLNWRPGETRAAAAIAGVDRGRSRVRTQDAISDPDEPLTHLVADVFGYFT